MSTFGSSMRTLGKGALVGIAFTLAQMLVGGALLPPPPPAGPAALPLLLASNLLAGLVLVVLAARSPAGRGAVFVLLVAVASGIPWIYLAEAAIFDIGVPAEVLPRLFVVSLVTGIAAALVATKLAARRLPGPSGRGRQAPLRPLRLALVAVAYLLCYFTAGALAWPFVEAFYSGRAMPAMGPLAAFQLVRGAVLGLVVWLVLRHEPGGTARAALGAGLTLSLIGGVVPLMVPGNPYLPDAVRLAHLVEVGVSNLLFGALAAWLLAPRRAPAQDRQAGSGKVAAAA